MILSLNSSTKSKVGFRYMKKHTKNVSVFLIIVAAILSAVVLVCLITVDVPPKLKYNIVVPNTGNSMIVTLEISNTILSKATYIPLLLADKNIKIMSSVDSSDRPKDVSFRDADVLVPIGRGSKTIVTYSTEVGSLGKHGSRGFIAADYALFEGEQAFLLPSQFYDYTSSQNKPMNIGEISFTFSLPIGWEQITRHNNVMNPHWIDIYSISSDAFVFGKFTAIPDTVTGLKAFVLSSSARSIAAETVEGVNSLYSYYSGLFGSNPDDYRVIMLPKTSPTAFRIIGGAGAGSVAATFNPNELRDWQLLAHRMFHAFFDTAAPNPAFHIEPNLWFYEGLATYYENMSLNAMPTTLKQKVNINVDRQFALLFNRYLYLRIKDPTVYGFPPMEDVLFSSSEALTEFLHYTAAPLLVKLLEDNARADNGLKDATLKFLLSNGEDFSDRLIAYDTAEKLLGEVSGRKFCTEYLLSVEAPPLWYLESSQPSDKEVLEDLNDFEYTMGTWFKQYDESYIVDTVTGEQLDQAMANININQVSFVSAAIRNRLITYCPPLYALLNDYYYRAKQKGIDFLDRDLRKKVLTREIDLVTDEIGFSEQSF